MPKTPDYRQHSYSYWANFYASPSDLVISKATGSNPVAPVGSSRNNLSNLNNDIKSLAQVGTVVNALKDPEVRKGLKREDLDPKVQALYDQVQAIQPQGEDPSLLTRIFDVLSRPLYAVANAYETTIQEEQKANGSTDINDMAYIPVVGGAFWKSLTQGQAMWDGLAGYDKTTFAGVLDTAHPEMNDIAKGVLGFALDIGMDPTSYLGVGAIKSVSAKVLGEGAKIADEGMKSATEIANFVKADASRAELIRQRMTEAFDAQGLSGAKADKNFFDNLGSVDFTDPKAVNDLITSGFSKHPGRVKGAALAGQSARATTVQAVKVFLETTHDVMREHIMLTKFNELEAAALRDGLLVDPTKLAPESVIRTLTYEALTMPEAEVVGRLNTLFSRRGILESQISQTKKAGKVVRQSERDQLIAKLQSEKSKINAEINKLVTETRIDMTSQDVRNAIKDLANSDPEWQKLNASYKEAHRAMMHEGLYYMGPEGAKVPLYKIAQTEQELLDFAQGQLAHVRRSGMAGLPPKRPKGMPRGDNIGVESTNLKWTDPTLAEKMSAQDYVNWHPTLRRYQKALKRRDEIETLRSQKIADRVLQVTNDVNLPETARLAKYRKIKDWRKVAATLVDIYSAERKASKAAETAAMTADSVGDIGGTVKAIKAKEAMGRGSNKVNKAIENAKRELQYRMHQGELTPQDLRNFLLDNKIVAPDILHDFENLLPETSRILHFGEGFKPTTTKQMTAMADDVEKAITRNGQVRHELQAQAAAHADAISRQVMETALDLTVRSMSLEARKAFGLRVGFMGRGPIVASMAMPALIDKLVDAAYKVNIVEQTIKGFNKALVSSAGMDKELARIRGREAGRTTEFIKINGARIYNTFSKIPPSERATAFNQLMRSDVKNYVHPEVVDSIRYELGLIAQKFVDGAFPGMREPLTLSEVNAWLPGRTKLKDRKKAGWSISGGSVGEGDDPVEWLMNALSHNNLQDVDPAQIIWDLQIASEKALARKATIETIVQNFGIHTGTTSKTLEPLSQRLVDQHGYRPVALGEDTFIFDPETAKQLDKIKELFSSPKMMETFGEYSGAITQAWKRTVTVRNPGFHARNTFGDVFVSWLDGVTGIHGVQSHRMALRTVRKFRNLSDAEDPMVKAMGQPDMLEAYGKAKAAGQLGESHNAVLFKKDGKDWTIGDVWAAYVNEGLLSGYANTEFGAVFKAPGRIASTSVGQKVGAADAKVLAFSEAREDVFRLAHFIDIMRKTPIKDVEKAAAEAGARVRKFHFDYSDFTMTEKLMFARVFPFYKWTRKAMPLMVESLFAVPGKMMVAPKVSNNLGVAMGYGGNGPDVVTPEWITSRMLAPIMSRPGVTTYAGVALPYDALRAAGAPGDTVLGMLHPGLKGILEASMGQKVNGQDFDLKNYLTGLLPQSNLVSKQLGGTGTPEQLISFLTGVTLTQNNSKTIQSELIKRKDAAYGSQPSKPPTSGPKNYGAVRPNG
jgi:uncharacterized protein YjgD (DUF1641 family)